VFVPEEVKEVIKDVLPHHYILGLSYLSQPSDCNENYIFETPEKIKLF
jgi:hypothetical protein